MFSSSNRWYFMAVFLLLGFFIYLLSPILTPFAVSALIAYLFDPLADKLESWKLSRTLSVVIVFFMMTLIVFIILLFLIPTLEHQISKLITNLPQYFVWMSEHISPWLKEKFGIQTDIFNMSEVTALLKVHWNEAGGIAKNLLASLSKSSLVVVNWLMNLLLIPVVTFYLLRDWDILTARVGELIPRPVYPTINKLVTESNSVLSAFLRGQFSVMLALGIIYTIGLWIIGLDFSLLIGMGAGLVSFIPYLGAITGMVVGVIIAFIQFGDVTYVIYVLLVFGIGQLLEGMVLTPWLVGDRIGLHPVAVIFAVLAGGQLFGFVGILLGLPIAAVVMVLLRFAHQNYINSKMYGDEQEIRLSSKEELDENSESDDEQK
ncbi:MAG TPA: AI-2E family transporter [Gammaproteobacteria bacterium]|nr:AI-2E family transporter [Xanthomonadales bacterium]HOP21299.1 AI-2E family transporter [Gammaproteobacteria bacterium]HPI94899.1 AI-2E family transporter [Gammaproteobacteria bacterium]HPQ86492.1 AI-2E family transporter [Gammaproteobacteria bacterium]